MGENAQTNASGPLRRDAQIIGLLFASTTSMIGSGWLFGAYHASKIAGPLSIWSWVAGASITMLIALCFAELGVLFPRSGALVHMSHASHGDGLGRIWAWLLFLAYVPIPPVEAEAIVTYANNYLPYFLQKNGSGLLNVTGFVVCALLLGLFAAMNLLAVRSLLRFNATVTWWKLAVPILAAVVLITAGTHWNVWAADPKGYQFDNIFTALPAAGIVFSFLGFRAAIDLGGESSNPRRDIPMAVIGSVLISTTIYICLQIGFLVALRPEDLVKGWAHLSFTGEAGPFAGLATALGLGWLAALLYIDAYISPGGTGLIYITAGARILYAVGEMNAGPRALTLLNDSKAPWFAVLVMWLVGILFLAPFPAWQLMVNYATSITVLTYGLGPIVLMVLRRNQPNAPRSFRLWRANILAPLAFISSNWIIYWTGFRTVSFMFIIVALSFGAYALHYHFIARKPRDEFGWRYIAWLLPWFGGMWIVSALGDIDGGFGLFGFWPCVTAVTLWSLFIIVLALRSALPAEETAAIMTRIGEAI